MNGHSQTNRILKYMKSGRSLTPLGALRRFSCLRLAARIHQLKRAGINIESRMVRRNGKSFSSYSWG